MAQYRATMNATITLRCPVYDESTPANNPVLDQTVTVTLINAAGKVYDWTANAWDTVVTWAALGSEHKATLTADIAASSRTLSLLTAMPNTTGTLQAVYEIASGPYRGMDSDQWEIESPAASGIVAASSTDQTALDETELRWVQGDPQTLSFTCEDSAGDPVNITGHTIYFTLKSALGDSDADDSGATLQIAASIVSGPAGTCTVTVPAASCAALMPLTTYWWDLCDLTAGHKTFARGTLKVLWHVTNRTS